MRVYVMTWHGTNVDDTHKVFASEASAMAALDEEIRVLKSYFPEDDEQPEITDYRASFDLGAAEKGWRRWVDVNSGEEWGMVVECEVEP